MTLRTVSAFDWESGISIHLDPTTALTWEPMRAVRIPDPVPPADRARYVRLRQREELYRARMAAIAAVLGEDLQREAPARAGPY